MNSGDDLGSRYVVEHWPLVGVWIVDDLANRKPRSKQPRYATKAEAQTAADRLNGQR